MVLAPAHLGSKGRAAFVFVGNFPYTKSRLWSYFMKHILKKTISNLKHLLASSNKNNSGFTLVELLVTLSILAVFYGLIITNFSYWRGPQYVKVSGNELATTINRMHSSALSARSVSGNPARYYILSLTSGVAAKSYVLQAISAGSTQDVFTNPLETMQIPGGAYIQSLRVVDKSAAITTPACVQIVFSLPFGRTYIDGGCTFGTDKGQTIAKTQSQLDTLSNASLQVVIGRAGTTTVRTVSLDGVTGRVDVQ